MTSGIYLNQGLLGSESHLRDRMLDGFLRKPALARMALLAWHRGGCELERLRTAALSFRESDLGNPCLVIGSLVWEWRFGVEILWRQALPRNALTNAKTNMDVNCCLNSALLSTAFLAAFCLHNPLSSPNPEQHRHVVALRKSQRRLHQRCCQWF